MEAVKKLDVRTVISFALITIGLLGLVVLGIAWSKNRASQLAQTNNQPQQQTEPQTTQPEAPVATSTPSTTDTTGHIVPAAGATDTLLLVASASITTFMGFRYMQAYRAVRAYR